jgi:flagellar motor protein MotB
MFQRLAQSSSRHVDEENPYWISFSDIMAGLLFIFILASIVFIIELNKRRNHVEQAIEALSQANDYRTQLLDDLQAKLAARGIMVEVSDNKTVLHIPDEYLFFESSSDKIPQDKAAQVAAIGETLYHEILQGVQDNKHQFLDTIFVEGHTDSRPARTLELGNWGLAAHRAIQVWRFWTEENVASSGLLQLRNFEGKPLFSVSGYADTRRLEDPDDTADKQRRNRRIDLRFTVRQPIIEEYRGVLRAF